MKVFVRLDQSFADAKAFYPVVEFQSYASVETPFHTALNTVMKMLQLLSGSSGGWAQARSVLLLQQLLQPLSGGEGQYHVMLLLANHLEAAFKRLERAVVETKYLKQPKMSIEEDEKKVEAACIKSVNNKF